MRRVALITVLLCASASAQLGDAHRNYRLKDIFIKGAKAFPTVELQKQFALVPGDVYEVDKLRAGLQGLCHLYLANGYMAFTPVPDVQIDEAASLITVNIDLDEGPVFRVGKLTVDGEESVPGARRRMLKAWQSYEGTVFNDDVLKRFLRDVQAPSSVAPEKVFVIEPDFRAQIVNVRITLGRGFNL